MKILLAAEDAAKGQELAQALREATGNVVQFAHGPERALEIARTSGAPNVLVTEAFFEQDDGFVLRHHIRELNPELRTIFLTAHDLAEHAEYLEGEPFLAHPPDLQVLVDLINGPTSTMPMAEFPQAFGNYTLVRSLGRSRWGEAFEAEQTSVNRRVVLETLAPEFAADPECARSFREAARAKAALQHPAVLAVYEADEIAGTSFLAREFVDGVTLAELVKRDALLEPAQVIQVVKTTAEALSQLGARGVLREPMEARNIFLGHDGRTRLENPAIGSGNGEVDSASEIRSLGATLVHLLPPEASADGSPLARLLAEMQTGRLSAWGAVAAAAKSAEPKQAPADAHALNAGDRAAIAAVEAARRRQKRTLIWSTVGLFALLWICGGVVYWRFFRPPAAKDFSKLVEIPAGEFIYQSGEKLVLPAFWIDEHEVTIGQYARFLAALEKEPALAARIDHPEQPKGRSHVPDRWENLLRSAQNGKTFLGAPVDLNCPIMLVDWFDAWAYAKWLNRRLPTEQEWEKAARGTDGRKFPWGNEADATRQVNTAQDFHENPVTVGEIDGFNRWAPVDATPGDRSPYGVMGMAGNVSEWTATLTPGDKPVIRGGNYQSRKEGRPDVEVTRRFSGVIRLERREMIGFRTVADAAPPR